MEEGKTKYNASARDKGLGSQGGAAPEGGVSMAEEWRFGQRDDERLKGGKKEVGKN